MIGMTIPGFAQVAIAGLKPPTKPIIHLQFSLHPLHCPSFGFLDSSVRSTRIPKSFKNPRPMEHKGLLQSKELYEYILETSVYPQEPEPLKEIRALTASHRLFFMGTSPDAGQMIEMLLKLTGAKRTLEVGVYTGYSLLLTALTIPEDGKIVAIDVNREFYEIGRPVIEKTGVEHKIDFIESEAIPALDKLLEDPNNIGSFDYIFVDADKVNYLNYHEKAMKLVKVNGIIVYDNTLWYGTVVKSEDSVPETMKEGRSSVLKFNKALVEDNRVKISTAPLGDGITICRRVY